MATNSTTTLNFGSTVTLAQAAQLIMACPDVRFMLQGEPGIGKSSLLGTIKELNPDYITAYMDVPTMDLGDIAMPVVDHETKTTRYYPNARFQLNQNKPVAIMLDEFTKGAAPVRNMLHPMLEAHNPRLGDVPLPEGTLVFLTGNLSSDGVGDALPAHSLGRITLLTVSKPDSDQWLGWALNNDIDPSVMAFVRAYSHVLASYLDPSHGDNPYIFNPRKVLKAYVSPRSLARASNIVKRRSMFNSDTLVHALSGTIGEPAARDMEAYIAYQDQLPSWDHIVRDPVGTRVPDSAGACSVLVYGALQKLEKATLTPVLKYLQRMAPEWQAVFIISLAKNPVKQHIAFSNTEFSTWLRKNQDLL